MAGNFPASLSYLLHLLKIYYLKCLTKVILLEVPSRNKGKSNDTKQTFDIRKSKKIFIETSYRAFFIEKIEKNYIFSNINNLQYLQVIPLKEQNL
jgi:hypothetical protein